MSPDAVARQLRLLRLYAYASSIALAVLLFAAFRPDAQERIDVLEVERINVVEPDGRLALALSNGARIPGPILEGEELPRELSGGRVGSAGMLFYNERGDEVGGLTFRGEEEEGDDYRAHAQLAFDQFKQDQVVSVAYGDDGESRSAGIHVWDRSTVTSVHDLVDVILASRGEPGPEREAAEARLAELRRPGATSTHRVFLGSEDRTASLRLDDTLGRTRIRLVVDSTDAARLEILDADGNVVARLPER